MDKKSEGLCNSVFTRSVLSQKCRKVIIEKEAVIYKEASRIDLLKFNTDKQLRYSCMFCRGLHM